MIDTFFGCPAPLQRPQPPLANESEDAITVPDDVSV